MSTRAIAPIVGKSVGTVHSDREAGVQELNTSPVPERRTATLQHGGGFVAPGEEIPIDTEPTVDLDTGEALSERSITGMDGK